MRICHNDINWIELTKRIDQAIDKYFDKIGVDRAYFNFIVKVEELDVELNKQSEITLIDETQSFCVFCGSRTRYYDTEKGYHICAKCFGTLNPRGVEQ